MEQRWNFDASSRTRRLFISCTGARPGRKGTGEKTLSQTTSCFHGSHNENKAPADEKKWGETDSKGKDTKMSFLEYVDSIAVPGTWSGKLEAQVLAEALQMGFLVHTSWDINPEAHDTACFYFDYHCGHWGFAKDADSNHWLRKKRTFSPEEVDPAAVGFKRLRGGVARSICLSDFVSQKSSKKRTQMLPHLSFLILLLSMMALLLHVPSHVEVARILLSPLKNFRVQIARAKARW